MTRKTLLAALLVLTVVSTGCVTPFSDHGDDVRAAWARKAHNAHRRWDKYVLGLDWDDPTHDWHDPSYATGTMHRH